MRSQASTHPDMGNVLQIVRCLSFEVGYLRTHPPAGGAAVPLWSILVGISTLQTTFGFATPTPTTSPRPAVISYNPLPPAPPPPAGVEYNARARTLKLKSATAEQLPKPRRLPGSVAVVSADTSDQAIAEEVRVLSDYMGAYCFGIRDVGAANLHGLLSNVESLRAADVVVVVSGTDCTLPSLIAGITQSPVVGARGVRCAGCGLGTRLWV